MRISSRTREFLAAEGVVPPLPNNEPLPAQRLTQAPGLALPSGVISRRETPYAVFLVMEPGVEAPPGWTAQAGRCYSYSKGPINWDWINKEDNLAQYK